MSQDGLQKDELKLHQSIISLVWDRFGKAKIDQFVSRENTQ